MEKFLRRTRFEFFWNYVSVNTETNCWDWTGGIAENGYARFNDGTRAIYAHRFSYEYYNGKIPEGLTIDHLCRNRSCVNPAHLEATTLRENIQRGYRDRGYIQDGLLLCCRGHIKTPENTYARKSGYLTCRKCNQMLQKDRDKKRRSRMVE